MVMAAEATMTTQATATIRIMGIVTITITTTKTTKATTTKTITTTTIITITTEATIMEETITEAATAVGTMRRINMVPVLLQAEVARLMNWRRTSSQGKTHRP